MRPTIIITDTSTGETRSFVDKFDWHDASEFLWSEGNYGCDCNRHLFFARAANDGEPDVECGDGRFAIRITAPDGRVLYDETENIPGTNSANYLQTGT